MSLIGKREDLEVVTWGVAQEMTVEFFEEYCDEAWAFLSPEVLVSGYDINGFSADQLRIDLTRLDGPSRHSVRSAEREVRKRSE